MKQSKHSRFYGLIFSAVVIVIGVIGLYFKIEHSGWILGVGLVCGLLNAEES